MSRMVGTWISGLGQFALIGAIGFLIDAGILTLLVTSFGEGVYSSRIISFSFAVTATWLLNKRFTFAQPNSPNFGRKYVYYILVQVVGILINLGVYFFMILKFCALINFPVVALATGSAVAMLSNYSLSRRFVFGVRK